MDFIIQGFFHALHLLTAGDSSTWSAVSATLKVSTLSMLFSVVAGLPCGFFLGYFDFKGKRGVRTLLDTMLALPTVFIGLMIYAVVSSRGSLGDFNLLFTLVGIAMGQSILAFPIITALTASAVETIDSQLKLTLISLGAGKKDIMLTCMWEVRYGSPSDFKTPGIIIASHDHEWLQGACDSLFQLYHGKIFQAGSKNIIPGPFIKDGQGFFYPSSTTEAEQTLRVTAPPHDKASALLKTDHIRITAEEYPPKEESPKKDLKDSPETMAAEPHIQEMPGKLEQKQYHTVRGEVLRLMGDKKNGYIIMAIKVNEMNFTIQANPEAVVQSKLLPSSRVMLTYALNDIEWI